LHRHVNYAACRLQHRFHDDSDYRHRSRRTDDSVSVRRSRDASTTHHDAHHYRPVEQLFAGEVRAVDELQVKLPDVGEPSDSRTKEAAEGGVPPVGRTVGPTLRKAEL